MALADLTLVITNHAYEQYCDRVEPVARSELTSRCQEQLSNYGCKVREYLHIDGVWWVYDVQGGMLVFVTCYGMTNMDIPAALEWARRHKDRINLAT